MNIMPISLSLSPSVADLFLYTDVTFRGMKLAGIVSISLGFVVVLLPSNLADIFLRILRCVSPDPVLKFSEYVCQPACLLQIEHEGMKILTQPSESSHIVCNSIWLLRFFHSEWESGRGGTRRRRRRARTTCAPATSDPGSDPHRGG